MHYHFIIAFIVYFTLLIAIGLIASHKQKNASDYILGARSLNYWVTAISANASDMSVWLFLGFPGAIYASGLIGAWSAIGLIVFMFLNWQIIAPKLRRETEKYNALTLSTFFEKKLNDSKIRLLSACISVLFLTTYIAAGLVGVGQIFEATFSVDYYIGIITGLFAIISYTLIGGFYAIAWTDFFQGIFLLAVICLVPAIVFIDMGSLDAVVTNASQRQISLSLIPDNSFATLFSIITMVVGWGIGYFGQPHILNKFMAIKNPADLQKAKIVGTSWQVCVLFCSVMVGFLAIGFFPSILDNPEMSFIEIVKILFHPFSGGLILCGIFAATISTMDSQIIVLASTLSEDIYQKNIKKDASEKELLFVTRCSVIAIALMALAIALNRPSSIFTLISYCWFGLGSAFGPIVILCLYFRNLHKKAAFFGMLVGAIVGACWNIFDSSISAIIPGFLSNLLICIFLSKFYNKYTEAL